MAKPARISLISCLCIGLATLGINPAFAASSKQTPTRIQQVNQPYGPQGTKGRTIKMAVTALATALRSDALALVVAWVRTAGSRDGAAVISRNAALIANKLQELATWEELSAAMVEGQIAGALGRAGLSGSRAALGGYYIRLVLSETFF